MPRLRCDRIIVPRKRVEVRYQTLDRFQGNTSHGRGDGMPSSTHALTRRSGRAMGVEATVEAKRLQRHHAVLHYRRETVMRLA
jgi:hypothetical protein